jgi:polysaccharide biosynthesis protein PslH
VRSQADLDLLRNHLPTLVGFVLNPVGNVADLITIPLEDSQPDQVLFCGAMNREPNIEAASWLVYDIWPLVRAAVPSAELCILGAHPDDRVKALAQSPGVTVTGYVPSLRPFYARSRVVVAPTQVVAGYLNKIMDGLAAGRPVVATEVANRGAKAPCVQIAHTAEAFAASIVTFLRDPVLWRTVALQGRHYAHEHFDWEAAVGQFEAICLERVVRIKGAEK